MQWIQAIHKRLFVVLLLYLFFGLMSVIQQSIFGFNIFRQQMIDLIALVLMLIYIIALLFSKNIYARADPSILIAYGAYLIYSIISVALLFRFNYQFSYIFYSAYYMLFYTFLFYGIFFHITQQKSNTSEWFDSIYQGLKIVLIPVFVLALLQYAFEDSFFDIAGSQGKSLMARSELLGTFRPPSIFTSSYELGLFSCFILILAFAYAYGNEGKILEVIFVFIALMSVVLTQTRNVYVFALFILLSFWAIKKMKSNWLPQIIPYVFVLMSFFVLFYMSFSSLSGESGSGLKDSASTIIRFTYMQRIWDGLIMKSNLLDILFGWGLIQHAGDASIIQLFPAIYNDDDGTLGMDNVWLSIFVYQGIIGLILYIVLYAFILNRLLKISKRYNHPFLSAFTAFYMAYPGAGVFNLINIGTWGILTPFFATTIIALYHGKHSD